MAYKKLDLSYSIQSVSFSTMESRYNEIINNMDPKQDRELSFALNTIEPFYKAKNSDKPLSIEIWPRDVYDWAQSNFLNTPSINTF